MTLALTVPEAAAELRCSRSTVERLVRRGLLTPIPNMGTVRIARAELENFVNGRPQRAETA